jgi:hypothetical protein
MRIKHWKSGMRVVLRKTTRSLGSSSGFRLCSHKVACAVVFLLWEISSYLRPVISLCVARSANVPETHFTARMRLLVHQVEKHHPEIFVDDVLACRFGPPASLPSGHPGSNAIHHICAVCRYVDVSPAFCAPESTPKAAIAARSSARLLIAL